MAQKLPAFQIPRSPTPSFPVCTMIQHDGVVHNPLGGASYYFGSNLVQYIRARCERSRINVHVGTQPNSTPHIGNITTFAAAFALASALRTDCSRQVVVKFIYVETAPAVNQDIIFDGVKYQKSLAKTGDLHKNQAAFSKVLSKISSFSKVPYEVATQEYWRSSTSFPAIVQGIVDRRDTLGPHLSPKTNKLAIRAACPVPSCGLADKHGINNQYDTNGVITFVCPIHGPHRGLGHVCTVGSGYTVGHNSAHMWLVTNQGNI